jgi:hypothetical protein
MIETHPDREGQMMPLELSPAGERFFDYCLWEYQPIATPENKLRSINLLNQSLVVHNMGERVQDIIRAIRQGFGESRTVWGIKQEDGRISWELYFYDYARMNRSRSISKLLAIIKPWICCEAVTSEMHDYFMFSIDLNQQLVAGEKPLKEIQMYIGNVGSLVSSGICYAVTKTETTLKNFYFFFDAKKQLSEIAGKVCSSAYISLPDLDINTILWPELRDCQTIVVANKRMSDGIYFSRINVDQLIFFLNKLEYPEQHISFIVQNRDRLDHLLYDVGFDYRMEGKRLNILKSAYYGVF